MIDRSLVLWGDQYPGPFVASVLQQAPGSGSSRPFQLMSLGASGLTASSLTELLACDTWGQIVVASDLGSVGLSAVLDRIDGCRWVIVSGMESTPGPASELRRSRSELALLRGATVFETSLVFGRGVDNTISALTRALSRWPLPVCSVDDARLVQPVHIDDVLSAIAAHGRCPSAGCFAVAGDEAVPIREVLESLREMLGLRLAPVSLSRRWLDLTRAGRVIGRSAIREVSAFDQATPINITRTAATFGWWPLPLAHRLEQALLEAVA
jgi:hypothetical protein